MPPRKMRDRRKKRVQLGIIVSKATKEDIAARAHDTGLSQGQLCEDLIEKGLVYDRMLLEIFWKLERMEKALAEMFPSYKQELARVAQLNAEMEEHGGRRLPLEPLVPFPWLDAEKKAKTDEDQRENEDFRKVVEAYETFRKIIEAVGAERLEAILRSKKDEG